MAWRNRPATDESGPHPPSSPSMDHTISLATGDRSRSFAFYRDGLGLEAFGPVADDGVPEPLQLRLAPNVSLMLIPTGGFGWVAGEDSRGPTGRD